MEKKTELPGIYKVSEGVLINKDKDALDAYKKRRERERQIDTIQKELSQLQDDTKEIKELLNQLLKSKAMT